jgi:hypothetical protein
VSDAGDPVLAQWQYGLGRVVAWTSDAKGQWAKEWVVWQDFPKFWAQAVRWSTGTEAGGSLQPRVEMQGGTAHVTVDATAPDGSYINNLSASASVVGPDNLTSTVALRQTTAGRYEGSFPATEEGAYLLRVQTSGAQPANLSQTLGLVVPYSPEYRGSAADDGLLARIASLTGGRTLTLEDSAAAFEHNLDAVKSTSDLWPLLVLLAVLLLPFDIGARRLSVGRVDIINAVGDVRRRLGWQPRPQAATVGASTPEMVALFGAKERVRLVDEGRRTKDEGRPVVSMVPPVLGKVDVEEDKSKERSGRMQAEVPGESAASVAHVVEETGEESLATRLRRAREQRR